MEIQSATCVRIHSYGDLDSIIVEQVPIPELEDTQILVRIECAPINVSDLSRAFGHYNRQSLPHMLGIEGSGTVVKSGSHPYAQSLLGKRVSFDSTVLGFGTYSDYSVVSAFNAFPLRDSVTFEQAASLIINPMTVALMVEKLKKRNYTSVVLNAAASALGKMLIRWCKLLNIKTVGLVRRQEQVDILSSIGADYVFNTSDEGWQDAAKALTTQLGTKIGFDAICGSATQEMLDLLEDKGVLYIYGGLSGQLIQVSPLSFVVGDKAIKGVFLHAWINNMPIEKKAEFGYQIQDLIGDALKTDYQSEVTLDGVKDALKQYAGKKTDSKFLVRPKRD
ncbi:unnamed protein product [Blepharisma stoltei]|uniref:Enoyl reductase (ER) domain-containing protein n=1 Tax=Blepharisma stoltei TaxID=1481888 RepID=A0AAU9ILG5_9CILI|nr:unnamed protein product [Blepharisma stoltei]